MSNGDAIQFATLNSFVFTAHAWLELMYSEVEKTMKKADTVVVTLICVVLCQKD